MGTTYDLEHATAHHDAILARCNAAVSALLDSATPRNAHLAVAVRMMMDDDALRMTRAIQAVERTALAHYGDLEAVPFSEANKRRADETAASWERYEHHMKANFTGDEPATDRSVMLVLLLFPAVNLAAVQSLHAEVMLRPDDDDAHAAYRDVMIEVADQIPNQREALQRAAVEITRPDDIKLLRAANNALDTVALLTAPHRTDDNTPKTGR